MKLINNLFPKDASLYNGSKIAFYGFIFFLALMTWRAIIHMFFWETGLHDIANVPRPKADSGFDLDSIKRREVRVILFDTMRQDYSSNVHVMPA